MIRIRNLCCVTLLILSGCSPVYQSFNAYSPPTSAKGMRCVSSCDSNKANCVGQANAVYGNCKMQQMAFISACKNQLAVQKAAYIQANPGPMADAFYTPVDSCALDAPSCSEPDIGSCEDLYALCYRNCGGIVSTTSRCVRYCEGS